MDADTNFASAGSLSTLVAALATMAACGNSPPRPVDIEAADMCARCRMAVSQKRYAAELIDRDESVFKFDDIGCMVRFASERGIGHNAAAWFVMDYDSRRWMEAGQAHYVQSDRIPSPMRGGLLAVKDRSKAEEYAARFAGRVLTFDRLRK